MNGAIFDVDGTLLDSMNVWNRITSEFFRKYNVDLTEEQLFAFKDMTLDESIPKIRDMLKLTSSFDEVMSRFKKMAAEEYFYNVPLKPYAKEYLEKLYNDGIKIAVATSGYDTLCKAAFKRLGIIDIIDAYAFSSEVGCNKSNPDIYLLAAERINRRPHECTVYEDIVIGIEGAKKGGFKTTAIFDNSNASETKVLKQLSDHYITGWKELL